MASANEPLAIIGILVASGQVTSSLFTNGIAYFGGGITLSGLSTSPVTMYVNLNSSDTRSLDRLQLHLSDDEPGTIRVGERYPIQTSSYSGLSSTSSNIAGLTSAGSSSALTSLLSSLNSATNIPQVEYQDLGLTLKATPKVMRNDDVALTIDLKIVALSGSSANGNPILNNSSYSGVVTLPRGQGVIVASELSKQQSRSISGTPGFSEIPGLNNVSDNDVQQNYSTLLIVITPHVVRGTQIVGHTPTMRIEKSGTSR